MLYSYAYKKELTYIVELFKVFYLIKRGEKRTTKRRAELGCQKWKGKRGRKRKNIRTAVFLRYPGRKKKRKLKKVKLRLVIKYRRGKIAKLE